MGVYVSDRIINLNLLFNHFRSGINHHPLRSKSVWKMLSTSIEIIQQAHHGPDGLYVYWPPKSEWSTLPPPILLLRAWYISTNIIDIIVIFGSTMYVLRSTDQHRKFIAQRERERERERQISYVLNEFREKFADITNTWSIMWHICLIF